MVLKTSVFDRRHWTETLKCWQWRKVFSYTLWVGCQNVNFFFSMEINNSLNAYLSGITVCRWAALGALILISKLWQWHFPLVASCRHLELSCMGQSPSAGQWAILHPGLIQPHLPLLYCWADFFTLNTLHIVSSGAASPISPLLWHTSLQTLCHTHLKSCSFQRSDKIFCVERGRLALCLSSILSASAS